MMDFVSFLLEEETYLLVITWVRCMGQDKEMKNFDSDIRCGRIDCAETEIISAIFAGFDCFFDVACCDANNFILADKSARFLDA